jgi:hypothetical protein
MNIREHVETLRRRVRASGASYERISDATGGALSASWCAKFAVGRMANPRVDSLVALADALDAIATKEAA